VPAGFEPPDDAPEDPELSELFEPLSLVLFEPLSLEVDELTLLLELDELSLLPDSLEVFFGVLLYRSEYQPPPLRMKPAPPEIWRFALSALHFGQVLRGDALMGCSASQA